MIGFLSFLWFVSALAVVSLLITLVVFAVKHKPKKRIGVSLAAVAVASVALMVVIGINASSAPVVEVTPSPSVELPSETPAPSIEPSSAVTEPSTPEPIASASSSPVAPSPTTDLPSSMSTEMPEPSVVLSPTPNVPASSDTPVATFQMQDIVDMTKSAVKVSHSTGSYPFLEDFTVELDESKKEVSFYIVVADDTAKSDYLAFAAEAIRAFGDLAGLIGYDKSTTDTYGAVFDEFKIYVAVAPLSKTKDIKSWYVSQYISAGTHSEVKAK